MRCGRPWRPRARHRPPHERGPLQVQALQRHDGGPPFHRFQCIASRLRVARDHGAHGAIAPQPRGRFAHLLGRDGENLRRVALELVERAVLRDERRDERREAAGGFEPTREGAREHGLAGRQLVGRGRLARQPRDLVAHEVEHLGRGVRLRLRLGHEHAALGMGLGLCRRAVAQAALDAHLGVQARRVAGAEDRAGHLRRAAVVRAGGDEGRGHRDGTLAAAGHVDHHERRGGRARGRRRDDGAFRGRRPPVAEMPLREGQAAFGRDVAGQQQHGQVRPVPAAVEPEHVVAREPLQRRRRRHGAERAVAPVRPAQREGSHLARLAERHAQAVERLHARAVQFRRGQRRPSHDVGEQRERRLELGHRHRHRGVRGPPAAAAGQRAAERLGLHGEFGGPDRAAAALRAFREQRGRHVGQPGAAGRIGLRAGAHEHRRGDERHVVARHHHHAHAVGQALVAHRRHGHRARRRRIGRRIDAGRRGESAQHGAQKRGRREKTRPVHDVFSCV